MIPAVSIVSENEFFVVADKPAGIASAPVRGSAAPDALRQLLAVFPDAAAVSGLKPEECGLVHRIDTATRGLLLLARTQSAFDFFQGEQKAGRFEKTYTAYCTHQPLLAEKLPGFPPPPAVAEQILAVLAATDSCKRSSLLHTGISSYFRPYGVRGAAVRPVPADGSGSCAAGKKAGNTMYHTGIVSAERTGLPGGILRLQCRIARGFRHQVRCHLAWCGFPVAGDTRYNPECLPGQATDTAASDAGTMLFFASGLSFVHPGTGKRVEFTLAEETVRAAVAAAL